jgi:cytochrome c-type biogenesis protein CcmH
MRVFFLLIIFISASCNAQQHEIYPLASKKQQAQFKGLLKELRCLVCQNQDLADSNAGLAKDLRQQVYEAVKQGQSDSEIIDFLTKRYGDFILFKPPIKAVTYLLWFGPFLFLLFGIAVFLTYFKKDE